MLNRIRFTSWIISLVGVVVLYLSSTQTALAAGTITVTTPNDEFDGVGAGTGCSLREAIESANTDSDFGGCIRTGTPLYTIDIPANTYLITLDPTPGSEPLNAEDDFDIRGSVTLNGAGADSTIIDGNGIDRVFDVNPGGKSGLIVTISGVTIQNGNGGDGSGIQNLGTDLTLNNVVVRNNSGDNGGGIYNEGVNMVLNAMLTLNKVTISGNTSAIYGGGVYNYSINADATLALNNSTVSSNTALIHGGGIASKTDNSHTALVTLNNSTVTNNDTGLGDNGGGIINLTNTLSSTITIQNSIVAGNKQAGIVTEFMADCGGTVTSQGYNLVGIGTGCPSGGTGDQTVTPTIVFTTVLGSLQDNGGTMETHALLAGSPAVNGGNPGGCTDGGGSPLTTDQRGIARPQGTRCDIGAYEAQAELALTKTIDNSMPLRSQLITYTLTLSNGGALTATNTLISDTLPTSVTFAGPLRLFPSGTTLPAPGSSTLASALTITPGQQISLTVPVTVNVGVTEGEVITNTASATSTELMIPVMGLVKFIVAHATYLPAILKSEP